MFLLRPMDSLAGFHAHEPNALVPELHFFGDRWTGAGFYLGEHTHSMWEFYLQVAGRSAWECDGAPLELRENDFWAVAPGCAHRMTSADAKQHFLYAAVDLQPVFARHEELRSAWTKTRVVRSADRLLAPFQTLAREMTTTRAHGTLGVRLALDFLVLSISRALENEREAALLSGHPVVSRARALMEAQPARAWTLRQLGRLLNVSPTHLAELFSREVGVPPRRYLLNLRVERAKEMLRQSDAPITQVALELGFASGQHFAQTFRKATGQTARQWRDGLSGG